MTRKTVGYVKLEWTCPACGNVNKGTDASCRSCGAAMPDDIAFELRQGAQLDTSKETEARAKAGPDIICPYCGTRNRATATACMQCGGDFTDAEKMAAGRVMGAFDDAAGSPITCPACGAENPPDANNCSQCGASLAKERKTVQEKSQPTAEPAAPKLRRRSCLLVFGIMAIVAVLISLLVGRCGQSTDLSASVTGMSWAYSTNIEGLVPGEASAWHDNVPADAEIIRCEDRLRSTSDEPIAGAVEACGTPYVIDTGTGVGQVVQDCVYETYEPWCTYRTYSWAIVDTVTKEGTGTPDGWPQAGLLANQRLGTSSEAYKIEFTADGRTYTYTPSDLDEYLKFAPGQGYTLTIGGFGQITHIEAE